MALWSWSFWLSFFFFFGALRVLADRTTRQLHGRTLSVVAERGECPRTGDVELGSVSHATLPQDGSSTAAAAASSASYSSTVPTPQVATARRPTPATGPRLTYPSTLRQAYLAQPAQ